MDGLQSLKSPNGAARKQPKVRSEATQPWVRPVPIFIEPEAGVSSVFFRNESGVDTRLMVWTATEDQAPAFTKRIPKGEAEEIRRWGTGEK